MEADVKELVELGENAPYFIKEEELGKFYIVKRIEIFEDNTINFDCDDKNHLILGMDILEIPNRKLEIIVEYAKNYLIRSVVSTLKKYAYISNYDYVSYENYSNRFIIENLCTRNNLNISKIMPRLFRKIINN